jgi:hypothetical protein
MLKSIIVQELDFLEKSPVYFFMFKRSIWRFWSEFDSILSDTSAKKCQTLAMMLSISISKCAQLLTLQLLEPRAASLRGHMRWISKWGHFMSSNFISFQKLTETGHNWLLSLAFREIAFVHLYSMKLWHSELRERSRIVWARRVWRNGIVQSELPKFHRRQF